MKYLADPFAIVIVFGAALAVIGSKAEPAAVTLPQIPPAKLEAKVTPADPAQPPLATNYEEPAGPSCRGAAWPHLPTDCLAQASAERQIRVIR